VLLVQHFNKKSLVTKERLALQEMKGVKMEHIPTESPRNGKSIEASAYREMHDHTPSDARKSEFKPYGQGNDGDNHRGSVSSSSAMVFDNSNGPAPQ